MKSAALLVPHPSAAFLASSRLRVEFLGKGTGLDEFRKLLPQYKEHHVDGKYPTKNRETSRMVSSSVYIACTSLSQLSLSLYSIQQFVIYSVNCLGDSPKHQQTDGESRRA
jgi:hypothetical protein